MAEENFSVAEQALLVVLKIDETHPEARRLTKAIRTARHQNDSPMVVLLSRDRASTGPTTGAAARRLWPFTFARASGRDATRLDDRCAPLGRPLRSVVIYESVGSGSLFARESLKKSYRRDASMEEGLRTAVQALVDAADEDRGTGGIDVVRRIFPTIISCTADGLEWADESVIESTYREIIDRSSARPRA